MQVKELMSRTVATVLPSTPLTEVASKMRERSIGFLPVCEGEKLAGIVTDRDIVLRIVAAGRDPNGATAADAMTGDIIYCFEHDPIDEAARLMAAHQVRRLVVLDVQDKIVGVVSIGDLAKRSGERRMPADTLEAVSEDRGFAGPPEARP